MVERVQTLIIGSGPAGLSAAIHAASIGHDHLLIEKSDHLSDTIFRYQRGKHVMATPSQLVLRADCSFAPGMRETILATWNEQVAAAGVRVRYRSEAKSIEGSKGDFTVTLTDGEIVLASTIVLAIGTQGNPNLMRCDGGRLAHVQYQLEDPTEYIDEHIVVIGGGDAGIENALGLAADPAQGNTVTILNRSADFARAKEANAKAIAAAAANGRITILSSTTPAVVEPGWLTIDTPDGSSRVRCDRIVARLGSKPPRAFVESMGVRFTSETPVAYPELSPIMETSVPGIHVIGALAGYPLIKHCLNQGYDVIEQIVGNTDLRPADEPILESRLAGLPGRRSVGEWLEFLRSRVQILRGLSLLQMREFMLESDARAYKRGEVVFERNAIGSSLFGIAAGSVLVQIDPKNPAVTVAIAEGSIFGEVGLISGRRRGATIRAGDDCILVEISRTAALRLMATVPEAKDTVERITNERQLLQVFKSGLIASDVAEVIASAETRQVKPGEAVVKEGEKSSDIFIIRSGSMVVEKEIAGRQVFLSYLPAGSYFGEMALIDGNPRTATVRAAVRSVVLRFDGEAFQRLLLKHPALLSTMKADMAARQKVNAFIEGRKASFSGVVDMYSEVAGFLVEQGLGEATDVLLIDETLCVGCDNCEKACADTHDGLSRLDREGGRTYAHLHVPTSCRHCEHPYCMTDCPPNAIHRGPDGEVFIDDSCIGCGNCQRNCPYGVIRMDKPPPPKPGLLSWMFFGAGPGPGEPDADWKKKHAKGGADTAKTAIKCDMCKGKAGGPACVRACPTGAAIRVSPENFLSVALLGRQSD